MGLWLLILIFWVAVAASAALQDVMLLAVFVNDWRRAFNEFLDFFAAGLTGECFISHGDSIPFGLKLSHEFHVSQKSDIENLAGLRECNLIDTVLYDIPRSIKLDGVIDGCNFGNGLRG